ncbi:MAG: YabP/YqfC family sporulation protein [Lachnospiraceae bacterium]|nr:YabP/YqfC family sporulation protein [Lachnospiraceae bacterium]
MGKMNFGKWKEELVENLELPKDLVYGAVLVTITGRQEVLVENYRGILEYDQVHISLQTKTCRLLIQGKNLHIAYYTNEEMKITGIIDSVEYEN